MVFDVPGPAEMGAGRKRWLDLASFLYYQRDNMRLWAYILSPGCLSNRQEAGGPQGEPDVGIQSPLEPPLSLRTVTEGCD
jgi:hypothetical protein